MLQPVRVEANRLKLLVRRIGYTYISHIRIVVVVSQRGYGTQVKMYSLTCERSNPLTTILHMESIISFISFKLLNCFES